MSDFNGDEIQQRNTRAASQTRMTIFAILNLTISIIILPFEIFYFFWASLYNVDIIVQNINPPFNPLHDPVSLIWLLTNTLIFIPSFALTVKSFAKKHSRAIKVMNVIALVILNLSIYAGIAGLLLGILDAQH